MSISYSINSPTKTSKTRIVTEAIEQSQPLIKINLLAGKNLDLSCLKKKVFTILAMEIE
ncbi:MAG: hypothetical protein WBA93_10985 [Microcoleaceae cyanobacterium]